MVMAGLWNEWTNKETGEVLKTVAIVTVEPSKEHLMAKIHNKPAKSDTPRMPLILKQKDQNDWLMTVQTYGDMKKLLGQAIPYPDELLSAYSVGKIKGKEANGNSEIYN